MLTTTGLMVTLFLRFCHLYFSGSDQHIFIGFHVANSIYSMLKNSPGVFNPLEVPNLSNHGSNEHLMNYYAIRRVWQCSSGPCAMISTTGVLTTSSWSISGEKKDNTHAVMMVIYQMVIESFQLFHDSAANWEKTDFLTFPIFTGRLLRRSTQRRRWRTITSTWPSTSCNRSPTTTQSYPDRFLFCHNINIMILMWLWAGFILVTFADEIFHKCV